MQYHKLIMIMNMIMIAQINVLPRRPRAALHIQPNTKYAPIHVPIVINAMRPPSLKPDSI
jgi:hypothetical protein